MILIISSHTDIHGQAVIRELTALGRKATVLDLSQYPQQMHLSWHYANGERDYHLSTAEGNTINLTDYRVIWWRRPQPYDLHAQVTHHSYRQFVYAEIYEAFTGMWKSLDAFWINNPAYDDAAHRKVYQLRVAQEVGLRIPHTLITSCPKTARSFVEAQGINSTIYKSFTATKQQWRETRLLKADELTLIDNVRFAPVIFQEYIPAQYDVRITVVGEKIFAAAIHSQETSYKVDMRMDISNARIVPTELPQPVKMHLHTLMSCLGLVYGAIDMRLTPDSEYVFLEINPAGQWLFIEEETQQPIAAALAQLMVNSDR
ncbi:MAG: alpha-L-glutamate ligase [bacterium]|nr:alpha-L-glutamate ligase [bacterium]